MNALTTQTATAELSAYQGMLNPAVFDHMQRVGKMLALSPLFPEHLRKGAIECAIANGVLVINMAMRLREDPLTLSQNIYFVGGKPGWSTTYMIAKANQHGVFRDVIDWDVKGKGDALAVTAFGVLKSTGKRVAVTCDMDMAKREGWTKNAKYTSMPEQMLRYRSAAFLIRLYCPEVMIGLPAQVELELQTRDVTPPDGPATVIANADAPVEGRAAETVQDRKTQADPVRTSEAERNIPTTNDPEPETTAQDQPETVDEETGEVVTENDEPAPDAERFEHLALMMMGEIENGVSRQEMEDTYGPQLSAMKRHFPAMAGQIEAAMAARER